MKRLFLTLLLVSNAYAFDVGTNYNSANMSYPANSTIQQSIVFNDAMRAGGTFEFKVDAHSGGGRPLQHDTAKIQIQFWNGGTHLGTKESTVTTLEQMNAWSGSPGDNNEPWETLSVSSVGCTPAASCANVTHVKVVMIGTDTSWWAGNYGPQWRLPTFTMNGGRNLAYNPEFGNYGDTMAQGWTSSSGWGACGTTSGSVMCTTSAAGVTANISGGGYDANGGTTSGTSGGYTSTLSVANANAGTGGGAATPPPPPPEPVPVVEITTLQQQQVNTARQRQTYGNQVYINQIGSYNSVDVLQSGTYNLSDVIVDGDNNNIGVDQYGVKNYSRVSATGNSNTVNVYQSNSGGNVSGHYSGATVLGSANTINVSQTGEGSKISFISVDGSLNNISNLQNGAGNKYSDIKAIGNGHTVILDQKDGGAHAARVEVTNIGGASNVNVLQQGTTNQSYLLQQQCATSSGCSVTITQQ